MTSEAITDLLLGQTQRNPPHTNRRKSTNGLMQFTYANSSELRFKWLDLIFTGLCKQYCL